MNLLKLLVKWIVVFFFKRLRELEINFLWNGYDIAPLGGNRIRINDEDYDLTPKIQTAFTDTGRNFNKTNMDGESVLTFERTLQIFKYDRAKDFYSKWTESIKKDLTKRVDKILNLPSAVSADDKENTIVDLQGERKKTFIPFNIFGVWTT